jgi:membrane protein DedA with SNARE-associated domain
VNVEGDLRAAPGNRFDILDGQVRAGQNDPVDLLSADRAGGDEMGLRGRLAIGRVGHDGQDSPLCSAPLLAFIDDFVIPFLNNLYGAAGYVGVMVAMTIESAMIPLPSELILPYAGFLVSDLTQIEPLTKGPWHYWIVVVVATIGNTIGSLIAYAIGAWGGRPFLERYGRYLLIRHHEIELADRFFQRYGNATAFFSRLLPIVRTFISFPAGVARMPLVPFIVYSTAGAFLWSMLLVFAGQQLGARWVDIRHALEPFDLAIAVLVVAAFLSFLWWRLGMPGRSRRAD